MSNSTSVMDCQRCGQDHANLPVQAMTRPAMIGDVLCTHWATCPTYGEPILLAMIAGDEQVASANPG